MDFIKVVCFVYFILYATSRIVGVSVCVYIV